MARILDDIFSSAAGISTALKSSGYRTDFTPASLWEIDRFFDEQAPNGVARPGGLLAEDLGQRLFAVGSYIGEVVRRHVGGEWIGDDADSQVEIDIELNCPDGTRCWPVQRVMKRFKHGPEDGIAVWGLGLGLQVGPRTEVPQESILKRFFR